MPYYDQRPWRYLAAMLPCEVATKSLVPSIKALIARELASHGLPQKAIAKLLGVTQPAVSLYLKGVRGRVIDLEGHPEVVAAAKRVAELLLSGAPASEVVDAFCRTCGAALSSGLLCELHRRSAPTINEGCRACIEMDAPRRTKV